MSMKKRSLLQVSLLVIGLMSFCVNSGFGIEISGIKERLLRLLGRPPKEKIVKPTEEEIRQEEERTKREITETRSRVREIQREINDNKEEVESAKSKVDDIEKGLKESRSKLLQQEAPEEETVQLVAEVAQELKRLKRIIREQAERNLYLLENKLKVLRLLKKRNRRLEKEKELAELRKNILVNEEWLLDFKKTIFDYELKYPILKEIGGEAEKSIKDLLKEERAKTPQDESRIWQLEELEKGPWGGKITEYREARASIGSTESLILYHKNELRKKELEMLPPISEATRPPRKELPRIPLEVSHPSRQKKTPAEVSSW